MTPYEISKKKPQDIEKDVQNIKKVADEAAWQSCDKETNDKSKNLAKKVNDPVQKEKLLQNAEQLDSTISKHHVASQAVLHNPSSIPTAKALDTATDNLDKVLSSLEDAVHSRVFIKLFKKYKKIQIYKNN